MQNDTLIKFTDGVDKKYIAIVNRLAEIIGDSKHNLDSAIKWKQLTYAKNSDFHHWICAIAITKKFVSLTFHFGGLLDDPHQKFISGTSKFLRKLEYRDISDVDEKVIVKFMDQSLSKLEYFKANWKQIQAME